MKQFIKHHPWQIIEEGFDAHLNQISESLCSIGNGRMGQRANFEEHYSGKSLSGTYLAGVYYPDKTRVGWWKNGYPEYFAKVLNAPNFIGIDITINDVRLDLATCKVLSFNRILDMKAGLLTRNFVAQMTNGVTVTVHAQRLFSIIDDECAAIQYSFSTDVPANVTVKTLIDADVRNADANYDEMFWNILKTNADVNAAYIIAETKKTLFKICVAYKSTLHIDGLSIDGSAYTTQTEAGHTYQFQLPSNTKAIIEKYCTVTSNQNHEADKLDGKAIVNLTNITTKGYNKLVNEQAQAWAKKWAVSDIVIEGDVAAQQGIRFNIFQLNQTYTGQDERLNIGPKGFTGEKYGGSTYWDTEAYCIPFFLSTANPAVSRNLLVYRYKHLQKAIENAVKLGFKNGAALYPMVTMNGEECHNEWEITFEEIHRNGAIAYAIYNYINYTADSDYLADYGLEVLLGIARFWAQRISYSTSKKKYVMLGVTGPNEYENNVNNNWYTNYISVWCLKYTLQAIDHVKANNKKAFKRIISDCNFDSKAETVLWKDIIKKNVFAF
jgi:maltose phosphorylase